MNMKKIPIIGAIPPLKNIFKIWVTILAWYGVDLIVLL